MLFFNNFNMQTDRSRRSIVCLGDSGRRQRLRYIPVTVGELFSAFSNNIPFLTCWNLRFYCNKINGCFGIRTPKNVKYTNKSKIDSQTINSPKISYQVQASVCPCFPRIQPRTRTRALMLSTKRR